VAVPEVETWIAAALAGAFGGCYELSFAIVEFIGKKRCLAKSAIRVEAGLALDKEHRAGVWTAGL
jgi:hypothetical protein